MSDDFARKDVDAKEPLIDVDDAGQMTHWSKRYGLAVEDLRSAVLAVGSMPNAIRFYIKSRAHSRWTTMKPRPATPRARSKRRPPLWRSDQGE